MIGVRLHKRLLDGYMRLAFARPRGRRLRWLSWHERETLTDIFAKYDFIFWRRQVATFDLAKIATLTASLAGRLSSPRSTVRPDISFILPVHNEIRFTLACLESIAHQTTSHSYEILVGDDASTDDTAAALRLIPQVRLMTHPRRLGFLENCNILGGHAAGRVIAILNNDVVLFPDWIDSILKTLSHSGEIGLLGGMLLFPDGRLQEAGCGVDGSAGTRRRGVGGDPMGAEYQSMCDVDYCSAAAVALPADVWRALNGFDPRYAPAYYEDADLAFRVRKLGKKVRYQPAAKAFHFLSQTNQAFPEEFLRLISINQDRFRQRWHDDLVRKEATAG